MLQVSKSVEENYGNTSTILHYIAASVAEVDRGLAAGSYRKRAMTGLAMMTDGWYRRPPHQSRRLRRTLQSMGAREDEDPRNGAMRFSLPDEGYPGGSSDRGEEKKQGVRECRQRGKSSIRQGTCRRRRRCCHQPPRGSL